MRLKLSLKKLLLFLYALFLFFNSYFIITWSTFYNGRFYFLVKIGPLLSAVFLFLFVASSNQLKLRFNNRDFIVVFVAALFVIWVCFFTVEMYFSIQYLVVAISILLLLKINDSDRKTILKYIIYIFVVCSLPSAIYFILYCFHIDIPHTVLLSPNEMKTRYGMSYLFYPLGLIITGYGLPRPCGLFDEPGYMGTVAARLYAAIFQSKDLALRKWKACLVIIGISSFSLAFYVLFFARISIHILEKGYTKVVLLFPLLLAVYIVFININVSNPQMQIMQERLRISGGKLSGDTRTSKSFEEEFSRFLDGDKLVVLRGNGIKAHVDNANMEGSSSYKAIIYDYGIMGIGLLFFLLFLILNSSSFSKENMDFFIIYVLSMYQRPAIFSVLFIGLLVCGMEKCEIRHNILATLDSYFGRKSEKK